MINLDDMYRFINDNKDKIETIKVTSNKQVGFNCYEGTIYHINVKLFTTSKYKNKLLKVETNSSYMEDFENDEDFNDWIVNALD